MNQEMKGKTERDALSFECEQESVCVPEGKKRVARTEKKKETKCKKKKNEVRHGLANCEGRKRRDNSLSTHTHDETKEKKTVKDSGSFFFPLSS